MALTVDDIARTIYGPSTAASAQGSGAVAAARSSGRVEEAYKRSSERLSQQRESTSVQLSAYGKIKSGLSTLETRAADLQKINEKTTAADITKAVNAYAEAYNNVGGALANARSGGGKVPTTLSDDSRIARASSSVRSLSNGNANREALQSVGINVGKDGKLTVDSKALAESLEKDPLSVKERLKEIGQTAERVSARELNWRGNIGTGYNNLNQRLKQLDNQQARQEQQFSQSQESYYKQLQTLAYRSAVGITSYQQIGSL